MMPGRNGGRLRRGGSGGNAAMAKVAKMRAAVADAITPAMAIEVLRRLADEAKAGDAAAGRVFLERALGKAAEDPDIGEPLDLPDIIDGEALRVAVSTIRNAYATNLISGRRLERLLLAVRAEYDAGVALDVETRLVAIEAATAGADEGTFIRR